MVGLYCAVSGCKNNLAKCRSLGSDVTFHRFPVDPSIREIWTESCNRGDDWNKPNVFICSDHFTPSDLRFSLTESGQKRTYLVRGAVPSRNLPTSKHVCCAVGCNDAAPEILVRRFPQDIKRRTELLGDVPRKQGILVTDCYLCERHLALKQFLKEEVEELTKKREEEARNIVILEVSKIDGKHSAKVVEPQVKRRKVVFQLEGAESVEEHEVGVSKKTSKKTVKRGKCDPSDETLKAEESCKIETKLRQTEVISPGAGLGMSSTVSLASSNISQDPLPVLVKNGETSQLMFLHHSAHLQSGSLPISSSETALNSNICNLGKRRNDIAVSENTPNSSSQPTKVKSTGDLLVDRLHRRIQELEERIVVQRDHYKNKMTRMENKYLGKVKELSSRVREMQNNNTMHKNTFKRRPVTQSFPKPSPSTCDEVQLILGHAFTSNQIKKIINESEPVRWNTSELLDAFTLKSISYGAYTFVRNHLKYPLPSPKYLRRWLTKVEKGKTANNPLTDFEIQYGLGSESENESDEDLDMLIAETVKSSCGEITLGHPRGSDDKQEIHEDEEIREDGLQDSKEIIIIANREETSSSNSDILNRSHESENDFEVFIALDSLKEESVESPEVYVLKQRNDKPHEGDQIEDVPWSENLSECEMKGQSDNDESEGLEQVVIIEEGNEDKDSEL